MLHAVALPRTQTPVDDILMPQSDLRQAQIDRARPRRKPYSIRDCQLRGFGVRIAPCGRKRFFLHVQHEGTPVCRACGEAATLPLEPTPTMH